MTTQSFDHLEYLETDLAIAGVDGSGLFYPSDWGIVPRMIHTSCWRGYGCRYQLVGGKLLLEAVGVGLDDEGRVKAAQQAGPVLFGKLPEWIEATGCWYYDHLEHPIAFNGRLLAAVNSCCENSGIGGYRSIYAFESVLELVFEGGALVSERDCSAAMRMIRQGIGWSVPSVNLDSIRAEIVSIMGDWLDDDFRQHLDHYDSASFEQDHE